MRNAMALAGVGLLAAVIGAGCEDTSGFATLSGALEVAPRSLELNPVWAGIGATAEVTLRNRGDAPIDGIAVGVREAAGAGRWSATLIGSAIGPGEERVALVTLAADEGTVGAATATIAITSALDGEVAVPARASILPPPSCDDGNPCTRDRFDREQGRCVHDTLPDASACDDGSACTTGDLCLMGRCTGAAVTCDDGVECTVDSCAPAEGCVFEPVSQRCDDGDPCTDDVCAAGAGCENPPLEEGALCHFDGCTEIGLCFGGTCELHPTPNGVPCEDGDACTVADVCIDGACVAGGEVAVGPTEPIPVHPWTYWADLCAGPEDDPGWCWADTTAVGVDEVLAVARYGAAAHLVWRGPFVTEYGLSCDPVEVELPPTNALPAPSADAPPEGGENGAAEPPSTPICAAPVFLSRVPIAGGAGTTTQLTAARGPVAAAMHAGALDPLTGEPVEAEIAIAQATSLGDRVALERFDRDGLAMGPPVASGTPGFVLAGDVIAGVSVAIADAGVIAVSHGRLRLEVGAGDVDCAFPGCGTSVAIAASWFPGGGGGPVDADLHLVNPESNCAAPTFPGPLTVRDLSAAISEDAAIIHFRADGVGDCEGAPQPIDPFETWRIELPADLAITAGPYAALPDTPPANQAGVGRSLAAAGDRATFLWDEEVDCGAADCACPDAEGEPCDCGTTAPIDNIALLCRDWRLTELTGPAASATWRSGPGEALGMSAAPLWLDGEPAIALLSGGAVQLLRSGPDGTEALAGVAPAASSWRSDVPLVPGSVSSGLVAGLASALDPEALVPGEQPNHALVQAFTCQAQGAGQVACLVDDDCGSAEVCQRDGVCLPDPSCDGPDACEPSCWGACVVAPTPDAGPADAGAADAGAADAGSEDAGRDGGPADSGVSDAGAADASETDAAHADAG